MLRRRKRRHSTLLFLLTSLLTELGEQELQTAAGQPLSMLVPLMLVLSIAHWGFFIGKSSGSNSVVGG